MTNPYLNRLEARGKSSHGKASEKKLAKSIGARLTPASGALTSSKGDMVIGEFLIESKSTIHNSISLDRDFFLKIAHEARFKGKIPALTVSFVTGDGSPKNEGEWICIPLTIFNNLKE